jgi:hypothetical protein
VADPDWLEQMRREGRTTERGVNLAAFGGSPSVGSAHPELVRFKDEEDFQAAVIQLAQGYGWRVAHFRKVRVIRKDKTVYFETPVAADGKGFLDLELIRGRVLIKAELKMDTGRLRPEQELWIAAYKAAGVPVFVWYPRDWREIETTLRGAA